MKLVLTILRYMLIAGFISVLYLFLISRTKEDIHPIANIYSANICEQKEYGLVLAFASKLNGTYYAVIDNEGVTFNGWPYSNIKDFQIPWGQIISINVYPTANYGRYMLEVDAPGSFGEGLRDENFGEITDFCVESVRTEMQKLGLQQKFFKKTR